VGFLIFYFFNEILSTDFKINLGLLLPIVTTIKLTVTGLNSHAGLIKCLFGISELIFPLITSLSISVLNSNECVDGKIP